MYFDLFLPFPQPEDQPGPSSSKKKDKQRAAATSASSSRKSCWDGVPVVDREVFSTRVALSGHLGYSVVGCALIAEPSQHVSPSPFTAGLPYPDLDPRTASRASEPSDGVGESSKSARQTLVQVTRFHIRLDDSKSHPFTSANSALLREYDLLSVLPTSDKALQLACSDLSTPGPNQISIITLPLHERAYHFRLNRKQIRQALRNGVVFEIPYSAGLFPPPSAPADVARRFRQNWLTNAREIVRVTGGKGIILSSGPGGSKEGLRGGIDVVNLLVDSVIPGKMVKLSRISGVSIGLPPNLANDAVCLNPKNVLLRAQARKTFKAVLSTPIFVPPATVPVLVKRGMDDRVSPDPPEKRQRKATTLKL